jgi:hypothetical protein
VTNHAGIPSATEPRSIADLAADAAYVRRVLDLRDAPIELPVQRAIVIPDPVIPDRALAIVAGLDSYGD